MEIAGEYAKINHETIHRNIAKAMRLTPLIRPLPYSIHTDNGFSFTEQAFVESLNTPTHDITSSEIRGTISAKKLKNKQQLWERKLLDLSLRNNLLNMKMGKNILSLNSLPIDDILSHLRNGILTNDLDVRDVEQSIKELSRSARLSIEENGANTLFLSIGTLRWYEEGSFKPYMSPLLFLPVEIVRQSAHKYVIRVRDEEPIVNITLIEMLRQNFEVALPSINVIPEQDDDMIDWQRAFDIIRKGIETINRKRKDVLWEITDDCHLGIFSFTKFVMWNDIHHNANILSCHPLIQSLIEGRSMINEPDDETSARSLDFSSKPADYALPLDLMTFQKKNVRFQDGEVQ